MCLRVCKHVDLCLIPNYAHGETLLNEIKFISMSYILKRLIFDYWLEIPLNNTKECLTIN